MPISFTLEDLIQKGTPEFLSLVQQDPNGLGVEWAHVVSQILADAQAGLVQPTKVVTRVQAASITFLQSLQSFASAVGQGDADKSLEAAADLVATGFTSSGASQVINGLIQAGISAGAAAATGPAVEASQKFAGSLLSGIVGDAAGGLMASGVGAAVGAGISLLAGVFEGVFGNPPPPPFSIGTCGLYKKPDIVVRYVWMWGDGSIATPVVGGGPGNPNWRKFPSPNIKADAGWFVRQQPQALQGAMQGQKEFGPSQHSWWWSGSKNPHQDEWWGCFTFPGDTGRRGVDQAFYDNGTDGENTNAHEYPVYRQYEFEMTTWPIKGPTSAAQMAVFRKFLAAFWHAWKANREFALNGLKQKGDWEVLARTIALWNQAHSPSSTFKLAPDATPPLDPISPPLPILSTYAAYLLHTYGDQFGGSTPLNDDLTITINTGEIHPVSPTLDKNIGTNVFKRIVRVKLPPAGSLARQARKQTRSNVSTILGAVAGGGIGLVFGGPLGGAAGAVAGGAAARRWLA